ncbi:UDP-phosphate galactose phosphotransferase [Enterococcus silesiacus]|uniref:UDP-phosphate galactose phosphotransferase n=1 Tax=Enterococcus silesiacus TaxID=332949 RepID=A0ABM5WDT3_9ENTE|nr:sugar transferase [Enterococcus silesiacus]ALS03199.1 UDP-phosphate galactose phosphotransferase [Enterococcus silesiacus]
MVTKNEWNNAKRIIIIIFDILVFHFSIFAGFWLKFGMNIPQYNFVSYEHSVVYITIIFVFLNLLLGTYVFYNRTVNDIVFVTVIGQVLTILSIMIVGFVGRWFSFPRSVLIYSFIVGMILLSLYRMFIYFVYLRISEEKRVVIIGSAKSTISATANFLTHKNKKHKVVDVIQANYFENLKKILSNVDIVYIASHIDEKEKLDIYELVIEHEKKLFLNTSFENLVMLKPNMMNFEDESIIEVSDFKIKPEYDFVKRLFDLVIASLLLVLTSPIILITAILVKATSAGPVIYKQTRITLGQKEFSILKFRTMSATAEVNTGPVLSSSNDSRVTTVGRYLRALRIDELPQLFNVLKGDMSIVGPRPERPFFVDQFKKENKHYYLRHNVRAGITGYAQVYGKYASDYNSKLNFDLLYIKNYSVLLDMKILLQTIKILFDKISSKGVDEEEQREIEKNLFSKNNIKVWN